MASLHLEEVQTMNLFHLTSCNYATQRKKHNRLTVDVTKAEAFLGCRNLPGKEKVMTRFEDFTLFARSIAFSLALSLSSRFPKPVNLSTFSSLCSLPAKSLPQSICLREVCFQVLATVAMQEQSIKGCCLYFCLYFCLSLSVQPQWRPTRL